MDLKVLRKKCNLTQQELGEEVGVSQKAIASYEAGRRKPSPAVAERMAKRLGLTIEQMWTVFYQGDRTAS